MNYGTIIVSSADGGLFIIITRREAGGGDLGPGTFHIQISFGELSLSFHFDKLNRGVRF